jgi:hypothetical protein
MKHDILLTIILLFVILYFITAGVDVRADDSIETAGNVLTFALPESFAQLAWLSVCITSSLPRILCCKFVVMQS